MAQQPLTPLSNTELSAFCSQMGMILNSGISSIEGLSLMMEETEDKEEKQILTTMYDKLMMTGSFYEAVLAGGVFPEYMQQMVQIGEYTGRLDEVMNALAVHYDREAGIAQSIRQAVTYPMIMIIMMLVVIFILLTKVMPIFEQVFNQLGSELTGFSKAILNFGTALNRYSIVVIIIVAAIVVLAIYFLATKKGRKQLTNAAASFGGTKGYSEKLAACRFASGMALSLRSGMSPDESISYAEKLTDNQNFLARIGKCKELIGQGEELAGALVHAGVFSGIYARMTAIAAKTGSLDEVMQDIADQYQEEVDQRLTGIISSLEPTLVIILSVVVGLILLSVMLPLVGIMAGL